MTVTDIMSRRPHRAGPAVCLQCRHEWEAVSPLDTIALECPKCKTMQGVYVGLSKTELPQLQCNCGSFYFHIDTRSSYCCHCGDRWEPK